MSDTCKGCKSIDVESGYNWYRFYCCARSGERVLRKEQHVDRSSHDWNPKYPVACARIGTEAHQ